MKIKDLQGIQSKNPPKFTRKSSPSPTGHIPPMICPAYKLPLNAPTEALTTLWTASGINNPRHNCKAQLRRCRKCMAHALLEDKPWRQCPTLAELNSMMLIPGLRRPLFPFQLSDVLRIDQMKGRALVASEMGLGKTITAIAWLALHPEKRPVVILCPAHLKLHWERELRQTLPGAPNTQILFGTNPTARITGDIVIVNYDILANLYDEDPTPSGKKRKKEIPHTGWVDFLRDLHPQVIIMDEAHYLKSPKSLRTKATTRLVKGVPHVLALTGTPIINRPIEGYYIIQMIDRTLFPNFWHFARTYCAAKRGWFGWDLKGSSNEDELNQKLTDSIMIRRRKSEELKDLPDKLREIIPMELSNLDDYKEAENDFIAFVRKTKGPQAAARAQAAEYLTKIEALKQLAVKGKLHQATQWITDFLATGEKLVVFTTHKETVQTLMNKFPKVAVQVDGAVRATDRDHAVRMFQERRQTQLFVGNIKAAGTGITLTAARTVAFLELPWTTGELSQAEDRCHRIGQKNAVNIYYILAGGTIEERIAALLDRKRQVVSAIIDGKEAEDTELLTALLRSYL